MPTGPHRRSVRSAWVPSCARCGSGPAGPRSMPPGCSGWTGRRCPTWSPGVRAASRRPDPDYSPATTTARTRRTSSTLAAGRLAQSRLVGEVQGHAAPRATGCRRVGVVRQPAAVSCQTVHIPGLLQTGQLRPGCLRAGAAPTAHVRGRTTRRAATATAAGARPRRPRRLRRVRARGGAAHGVRRVVVTREQLDPPVRGVRARGTSTYACIPFKAGAAFPVQGSRSSTPTVPSRNWTPWSWTPPTAAEFTHADAQLAKYRAHIDWWHDPHPRTRRTRATSSTPSPSEL